MPQNEKIYTLQKRDSQDSTHKPIMVSEILSHTQNQPSPWLLDATYGRGGHCQAFKDKFSDINIMALDRDLEAYQNGLNKKWSQFCIYPENFHDFYNKKDDFFKKHSIPNGFDWILIDLGPSSPQLNTPERGFSFYLKGPLDMRMDVRQTLSAKTIINEWNESDLIELFKKNGEVKFPQRVVQNIIQHRNKRPIQETTTLAQIISKSEKWKKKGKHPATPYFLALRIEVNQEVSRLDQTLSFMINLLKIKGRIFVLTFHSLEDRIVKYAFKNNPQGICVNKKVIRPSRTEVLQNARSRSAKLRIFQREK